MVPFTMSSVKPTVTVQRKMTISSRANVSITCSATGHPRPIVKWEKLRAGSNLYLTSNPVLHLHNLTVNASGTYQCTASNTGGNTSAKSTLLVQGKSN